MEKLGSFLTGLREGWSLVRPYFVSSEERWAARGLLAAVIGLVLILTALNVEYTYWTRVEYDALQDKNFRTFLKVIFTYTFVPVFPYFILGWVWYAAIFTVVAVYATYLNQMLQIRWRRWMTQDFTERWLADRAYYNISLARVGTTGIDNPDQRISDDLNTFTNTSLSLSIDLINNIVTLFSFVTVLYVTSPVLKLLGVSIPGYMLYLAIIYSAVGTFITHRIGRRLINLNWLQQKVEADFRYSLIRIRENPEAIALSGGEQEELVSLRERFSYVVENWWAIMRRTKLLGFFTNTFNSVGGNFALVAAAPYYFSGALQLGDLIQLSQVFSNVQSPIAWIVTNYNDIVNLRATVARLNGFKEAMAAARLASAGGPQAHAQGAALEFHNLTLTLPDGTKLLENADLSLPPGEMVILTGASGSGKSTLFRAIAGIWPHGQGEVRRPHGSAMFLPQRPYFPLGSLKRAITYPAPADTATDAAAAQALTDVELGHLVPRLLDTENWGQVLSGGEQQRLALTRALVAKPNWLFLDEATAALDTPLANKIQAKLAERLPGTTIVSITHRDAVAPSQRHIALAGGVLAEVK